MKTWLTLFVALGLLSSAAFADDKPTWQQQAKTGYNNLKDAAKTGSQEAVTKTKNTTNQWMKESKEKASQYGKKAKQYGKDAKDYTQKQWDKTVKAVDQGTDAAKKKADQYKKEWLKKLDDSSSNSSSN